MCKLIDNVFKQHNATDVATAVNVKTVLADGAYESNKNFKHLQKKMILPGIKVNKNSIISFKSNKTRNREVRQQTKDLHEWKKKKRYGRKGIAETVFSPI